MTGNCGSTCPVQTGFYRYTPSIGGNAVLLAAHCLLIPAFLYLGFRSATPVFSITSVAGLALGVVGFLGRLLLHHSPERQVFFAITLIGTVLGPTFITGAVILTLRHTLSLCGDILTPLQRLFVVLLLFFLAAGAAILEAVGIVFVSYNMGDVGAKGTDIIVGGLGVQVIALFGFLGLHFWSIVKMVMMNRSVVHRRHAAVCQTSRLKYLLFGTGVASLLLLAYSVYRIIEMVQGPQGYLFQNQTTFMTINGILPLVAAALVTVFQPCAASGSRRKNISSLHLHGTRSVVPPPLNSGQQQIEERTHHRYDSDIGKQFSPEPQRPLRQPGPLYVPEGSYGLLSHPKPVYKTTSSYMPSQKRVRGAAIGGGPSGQGGRSDTMELKMLVDKDTLW